MVVAGNAPVNVPTRFAPRGDEILRVCRRCIEDDLATTGDSYYRCHHQIREVCECSKHRVPLISTACPWESATTSPRMSPNCDCAALHNPSYCFLMSTGSTATKIRTDRGKASIAPIPPRAGPHQLASPRAASSCRTSYTGCPRAARTPDASTRSPQTPPPTARAALAAHAVVPLGLVSPRDAPTP